MTGKYPVIIYKMVQTRSQTRKQQLQTPVLLPPFEFDFDESSKAWRENKRKLANGTYSYICGAMTQTGKKCQRGANCRLHCKK